MPKYHLVSDVLHDLVIDDEGIGYAFVRKIIDEEWAAGKIKLLRVSPGIAEPEVWEPAQRRLILNQTSGERFFKCSIEYRTDRGLGVTEFGDPFISDEDVQYVAGRAAEAGLVLAEPISGALLTGEIQSPEPGEILSPATAEMAETEDVDIAKASSEVAIVTPPQESEQLTGEIQSPEPAEILSPTTAEMAETEDVDVAPPKPVHTIARERECQAWLVGLMRNDSIPVKRKKEYYNEALRQYGTGTRAFVRAWGSAITETGNEKWSKPGRKSGHLPDEKS